MKKYIIYSVVTLATAFLFGSCIEEDSIKMPDYEVGIVAKATIAPGKYWFNINNLEESEVSFELSYEGFDTHTAEQIDLYIGRGPTTVFMGSYSSFPSSIALTGAEAYAYFGQTAESVRAAGVVRDEFRITYKLTTTDGEVFDKYGQYYNYNPSLDGRFTGRYAQFYTNLPGFGTLVLEVRQPNPQNPNER